MNNFNELDDILSVDEQVEFIEILHECNETKKQIEKRKDKENGK